MYYKNACIQGEYVYKMSNTIMYKRKHMYKNTPTRGIRVQEAGQALSGSRPEDPSTDIFSNFWLLMKQMRILYLW